jgi:hypothetical protein
VAYSLPLAFTSALEDISNWQTSRYPTRAERFNGVSPLGEAIELAKMKNEKKPKLK